jgi:aspartate aminotransferase-like enzyme
MAHWETGSGRINDLKGFSDACLKHGVMGLVDAASSLGVADFSIDDYPGVVAWASCPQKGVLSLPLTYAPVSFTDKAIDVAKKRDCYTYVHHPILEARHWGIIDGRDVSMPIYHRTHSCYAVAAFHEALRIILGFGRHRKASQYAYHEKALRQAVEAMGCDVISNTTSLIVLNCRASSRAKRRSSSRDAERTVLASGRRSHSLFRCASAFSTSLRQTLSWRLPAASLTPCSRWALSSTNNR